MKTCTIDGCDRKHDAKGLCRTHYRASRPRRPDTKVELPCDGCGTLVLKEKRTRRYATVQCESRVCRTWLTWGATLSEELPANHWALHYGATCEWTPPSVKEPKPKLAFDCQWCGEPFKSYQPAARYCGTRCVKRRMRKTRRAREYNAPGEFTWTEVTRLWLAFDKRCAYCEQPTSLSDIQAEHVRPLSKSGRNDISNILPSCAPCNTDKRDVLLHDWAADRARRGLSAVKTSWDETDRRYWHLVLDGHSAAV